MSKKQDNGKINIHGKEYLTVAYRVNEFRTNSETKYFSITTEILQNTNLVVIKAFIINKDGFVMATGHAEEDRSKGQINKTSALENAETSAIGRALASFGLGGTEFASANEVQNAIHQQQNTESVKKPHPAIVMIDKAIANNDTNYVSLNWSGCIAEAWSQLNANQINALNNMGKA